MALIFTDGFERHGWGWESIPIELPNIPVKPMKVVIRGGQERGHGGTFEIWTIQDGGMIATVVAF